MNTNRHHHDQHQHKQNLVEDAVRFLHKEHISLKAFVSVKEECESFCETELHREYRVSVKRSFVRLLGATDPEKPSTLSSALLRLREAKLNQQRAERSNHPCETFVDEPVLTSKQQQDQDSEDFYKKLQPFQFAIVFFLQLYFFISIPLRYAFTWERPSSTIIVECIFCDLPLWIIFVITYFLEPTIQFGTATWPFLRDRFRSHFFSFSKPQGAPASTMQGVGESGEAVNNKDNLGGLVIAWMTFFALLPLELIGEFAAGGDSANPIWQANRLLHSLRLIETTTKIIEQVTLVAHLHPEVTRIATSFARLLFSSHIFACIAIRWRDGEPVSTDVNRNASDVGGNVSVITEAFAVYVAKHDCMLKQMTTFECGPSVCSAGFASLCKELHVEAKVSTLTSQQ